MRKFTGVLPAVAAIGMAGGVTGIFLNDAYVQGSPSFFVLTSVAAAIAGACVIPFFGRPHKMGYLWALLGGVLATFGASTVLGLLLNYQYFVIAPMTVAMTLTLQPLSALSWFFFMGLAHFWICYWRHNQKQTFSQ